MYSKQSLNDSPMNNYSTIGRTSQYRQIINPPLAYIERSISPSQSIAASYQHVNNINTNASGNNYNIPTRNPQYSIIGTETKFKDPSMYPGYTLSPHQQPPQYREVGNPISSYHQNLYVPSSTLISSNIHLSNPFTEENQRLQERILLMGVQIERLNSEIMRAIHEVEDNRNMIKALRSESEQLNDYKNNTKGASEQKYISLKNQNKQLIQEKQNLRRDIESIASQCEERRTNEKSLRRDKQELMMRLGEMQRRINMVNKEGSLNKIVESQLENYRYHIQEHQRIILELQMENTGLINKNNSLERNNTNFYQGGDIAQNFEREIQQLTQQFIQEKTQMDGENRQLRAQANDLQLRNSRLERGSNSSGGQPQNGRDMLIQQLNELRNSYSQIENVLKSFGNLDLENNLLKEKIEDLKSKLANGKKEEKEDYYLEDQNQQLRKNNQILFQENQIKNNKMGTHLDQMK